MAAGRFFNTEGPVNCAEHYCLDPLVRIDLPEILTLIDQKKYFVLHAPRQTGKTSCLLALMAYLNQGDEYTCLYMNVEKGQSAREDVARGMRAIVGDLASNARDFLGETFPADHMNEILAQWGEDSMFSEVVSQWCGRLDKPLVLLIDEVDALIGDTLISLLRQIRAGYHRRPRLFPQSIILCGVRDVRDYRIHSSKEKAVITGGSAFNIKAESLRLGDFIREEMEALYFQHTEETGQMFESDALDLAWDLTRGQPWLVNALAYETCFRRKEGRDRTLPITREMMNEAKEALILRRVTHLDQLADKLQEERVRRVIGPILEGALVETDFRFEDVQYIIDLGLIRRSVGGKLEIANSMYREIIPRELTWGIQSGIHQETLWYVDPDGRLNMSRLLAAFQEFFREHSEHWIERFQYKEAGPQLLLQAFLQRIVNSGGRIEREYGLGRMRTDLLVIWKGQEADVRGQRSDVGGRRSEVGRQKIEDRGNRAVVQKVVIELKVLYKSLEKTIADGVAQTREYMDRCGVSEGHLVIFDRTEGKPWEEKIFKREAVEGGAPVTVWGM